MKLTLCLVVLSGLALSRSQPTSSPPATTTTSEPGDEGQNQDVAYLETMYEESNSTETVEIVEEVDIFEISFDNSTNSTATPWPSMMTTAASRRRREASDNSTESESDTESEEMANVTTTPMPMSMTTLNTTTG